MLPLVSNDAVAILFMFDLTRKATLNSVKEWYRQARGFNKVCSLMSVPFVLIKSSDGNTGPHRNKIRLFHHITTRGTGRDHKASQEIFESYARAFSTFLDGRKRE